MKVTKSVILLTLIVTDFTLSYIFFYVSVTKFYVSLFCFKDCQMFLTLSVLVTYGDPQGYNACKNKSSLFSALCAFHDT